LALVQLQALVLQLRELEQALVQVLVQEQEQEQERLLPSELQMLQLG
jgi:hypothetical protein